MVNVDISTCTLSSGVAERKKLEIIVTFDLLRIVGLYNPSDCV